MKKLLLVEDDLILQEMIVEFFNDNNYYTYSCSSYNEALNLAFEYDFDLWIFDVKIEDGNGFELLKELKKLNLQTPTIFTTSLNGMEDIEKGFKIGCSDYLKKPYELKELLIRANHLTKDKKTKKIIKISDEIIFDYESNIVYKNKKLYPISKKETKLLILFLENKNRLLSIDYIFSELWDYEEPSFLSLRAYIKTIRKLLGKDKIINQRAQGYIFVE